MKQRRPGPSTLSAARRLHWAWWLVGGLLVLAGLGAFQYWRVTAPPPPVVDVTGFDREIVSAIFQARKSVLSSPRSAKARGHMGMVLLAHEVRAPARTCFAQAAAFAPRDPRWPYLMGLAQLVDNPMAAVTNLQRAARLFPETESAPRLKLADTLLSLGRLEEAEAQYRSVWEREPNSAAAGLGLGKVANARDRAAEAADFLAVARENPSTRKAAHRLLVSVHQKLGHTNQAEQLVKVLEGLPNDVAWPDRFMDEVEELKTGEKAWTDRGDDWIKIGRVAEAAELLEKAVRTYPKSDRAMFFLGRARLRLGDVAGAEAILAQAVAVAPDSVEAQLQLGIVRLSRGQPRAAQPCFRAAIRSKPNLAQAWYNLGLTLGGQAERPECIEAFREAIRLKPDLLEAYLGLAVALRADGQPQAAAEELRRALDLNPEEPLRQKLLAQLRLAGKP